MDLLSFGSNLRNIEVFWSREPKERLSRQGEKVPDISVIVPVYNTEKTIQRCLESIMHQTKRDIEIIVVDDGSPDDAVSIVNQLMHQDNRIRLVQQSNLGLGAARNTGIRHAQGRYIACVDSDDRIENTMLEKMHNALNNVQADIAICQADNILYKDGQPIKSLGAYTIPGSESVISGTEAVHLQLNYIVPILFNSVCFKLVARELFEKQGVWFPEGHRFGEDTPTSVGLLLHANKVALVRENLYQYIREGESLTATYSLKKAHDIYLDMREICEYAKDAKFDEALDNFILGMIFSMEKQIAWASDEGTAAANNKQELKRLIDLEKGKVAPCFSIPGIPLPQRIKIICAHLGLTTAACKVIEKAKWIPFVKYML